MEDRVRAGLCKVSWRIKAAPDSTKIPPARFAGKRANYVKLVNQDSMGHCWSAKKPIKRK